MVPIPYPKGGSRVGGYFGRPNHPPYIETGYGFNMNFQGRGPGWRSSRYLYPARTGVMAETASFYWWNYVTYGNTAAWYADRHKPGMGNILFLDWHVAWEKTPYTNSGTDNLRNPS